MNEAPNNMTTGHDDEVTFDPEETSAADGRWLAELRANAKSSKQSMRELLDDETVGAGDDTMAQIREAVRAAQPAGDALPESGGPPGRPPPDVHVAREADVERQIAVASESLAPPAAPVVAGRPPRPADVPTQTRSAPPRRSTPTKPSPASPAQRWEPPPRLAPAIEVEPPAKLAHEDRGALTTVRLAAIAAVTLVAIVIVVLVWSRTGDAPAEPPPGSDVVVVDPDAPPVDDQVDPDAPPVDEQVEE